MPDQEAETQPTKKLIYVHPRIRLTGTAYGQESFAVSKAVFLQDEQKSWDEVLKLPSLRTSDTSLSFGSRRRRGGCWPSRMTRGCVGLNWVAA